jgi:hypothetical protein
MNSFLKNILLLISLIILNIPIFQQEFKLFPDNISLFGSFRKTHDTCLTYSNWFSGKYQNKKESYLNENFGFRNFTIKLNNQINYSLFNSINIGEVINGKNNHLYSNRFFREYSGRSYRGDQHADSIMQDVKNLKDWLSVRNKKLLVCFTPCKESFYPEYLPDSCIKNIRPKCYYTEYVKRLKANNISFLDLEKYLKEIKDTTKGVLYSKVAIHWTTYASAIALDTFFKKIRYDLQKNTNLIKFKTFELSNIARDSDDDISKAMNLLENINRQKFLYPSLEFIYNVDSCFRPKAMIIGDSFYFGLNNTWAPLSFFSKETYFFYYFKTAITYDPQKKDTHISAMNFEKELENTDIVILFYSVGTLDLFPNDVASFLHK